MVQDIGAVPWPSEGMERVPVCPVCGCDRRSSVYQDLTDRTFFCAPGSWELQRCEKCRCCYLDPRPTPEMIHLAYARYFTHAEVKHALRQERLSVLKMLRHSFANGYRNWRFGTRDHPATALGVCAALVFPPVARIADAGMRFIPRAPTGGRLLDVGAGNGAYLLRARSAGWETIGVELDAAAVAAARHAGLDVRQGEIHCLSNERSSIDVITMSHVIEHVHEPRRVLSEAFTLLRSGGILYVETPNVDSYGHREFGRHWRGLEPPRHLVLFNWSSLERLLTQMGFCRVERLRRSGIYPALAAKSRAIERGRDPETIEKSALLRRVTDTVRGCRAIFDFRRAEFITLLARKR